jgi:hypothetical protein
MRSFLSSRRGMEMAVGMLVTIILGIIILGGGIILLRQLTDNGEQITTQLSSEHQAQLRKMLTEGQLVATYPSSQRVVAGKTVIYGLAVQNRLGMAKTFTISTGVLDDKDMAVSNADMKVAFLSPITLQNNEQQELVLAITPKDTLAAGVYTVLVNVTTPEGLYDSTRFFTVRVQ